MSWKQRIAQNTTVTRRHDKFSNTTGPQSITKPQNVVKTHTCKPKSLTENGLSQNGLEKKGQFPRRSNPARILVEQFQVISALACSGVQSWSHRIINGFSSHAEPRCDAHRTPVCSRLLATTTSVCVPGLSQPHPSRAVMIFFVGKKNMMKCQPPKLTSLPLKSSDTADVLFFLR